jgi:predicted DNA-binding protein with PD1-like motif
MGVAASSTLSSSSSGAAAATTAALLLPYSSSASGQVTAHCFRLEPNDDLVPALQAAARQALHRSKNNSGSAFVLSAVGSLRDVTLRMANNSASSRRTDRKKETAVVDTKDEEGSNDICHWKECFEVVSLVGTFTRDAKHLHMSVSNAKGEAFGGHVIGGTVFTTLEVVIGTIDGVDFQREMDERTGYTELVVRQRKGSDVSPAPSAGVVMASDAQQETITPSLNTNNNNNSVAVGSLSHNLPTPTMKADRTQLPSSSRNKRRSDELGPIASPRKKRRTRDLHDDNQT